MGETTIQNGMIITPELKANTITKSINKQNVQHS